MSLRALPLLLLVLLSACASTTQVETRYQRTGAMPQVRSLLLVARTPETSYRETWENACHPLFTSARLAVTDSTTALPNWFESGTKSLTEWITANHLDAILLVDITNLLLSPPQMPGQMDDPSGILQRAPREDPIGVPTWNIFLGKKSKRPGAPPRITKAEAQLLDPVGNLLWDGFLVTHEANDLDAIATSQCKAIRKQLEQQGLLPPHR